MQTEQTKALIALVAQGDLEGAAAAIKKIMDEKRSNMLGEAKTFIGNSLLNGTPADTAE